MMRSPSLQLERLSLTAAQLHNGYFLQFSQRLFVLGEGGTQEHTHTKKNFFLSYFFFLFFFTPKMKTTCKPSWKTMVVKYYCIGQYLRALSCWKTSRIPLPMFDTQKPPCTLQHLAKISALYGEPHTRPKKGMLLTADA